MKTCKECRFFQDGECEACRIPMDGEGEPCDKFGLRSPITNYCDVVEKHRRLVSHISVSTNGRSALIVLKAGGGISVNSPEEADKELERLKHGYGK